MSAIYKNKFGNLYSRCGQETRVIPRILQMKMHWSKSEKENVRLTEAGISKEVSVYVLKTREIITASSDDKKERGRRNTSQRNGTDLNNVSSDEKGKLNSRGKKSPTFLVFIESAIPLLLVLLKNVENGNFFVTSSVGYLVLFKSAPMFKRSPSPPIR